MQVLPLRGQLVQTGSDVMSVVVHLLAVKVAFLLQAVQGLTELL